MADDLTADDLRLLTTRRHRLTAAPNEEYQRDLRALAFSALIDQGWRLTPPPQSGTDLNGLCRVMHDAYEEAAVQEGWATQERSRKPWEDVPEENKRTMRVAVTALLGALAPTPQPGTVVCGHTEHIRVRRMVGRQVHPEWRGRAAVGEPWELCKAPPQPGTVVTELDLIVFLEWLDSTRQVTEWGDPNATHEDTAREYLAQAAPSGNVTVSSDDLRALLRPYDATRAAVMNAVNNVASALAEVNRDH